MAGSLGGLVCTARRGTAADPDDPAPMTQTLSVSFLVSVDCMSIDTIRDPVFP